MIKAEIYDNFNGNIPSGKLGETADVYCGYAGYYSIPLSAQVLFQHDNDVYIKVKYNTGTSYPIPSEYYLEG